MSNSCFAQCKLLCFVSAVFPSGSILSYVIGNSMYCFLHAPLGPVKALRSVYRRRPGKDGESASEGMERVGVECKCGFTGPVIQLLNLRRLYVRSRTPCSKRFCESVASIGMSQLEVCVRFQLLTCNLG